MNQYYQILSSCRVPGPKQDSVVNFLKSKKPPTHITVVHNYQVSTTALSEEPQPQPDSSSFLPGPCCTGCDLHCQGQERLVVLVCLRPLSPSLPVWASQFFELDVYHSDGTPFTSDQIFVQLEKIWNSSLQSNKEPVGILTSNHRNTWSKAYNNLIKGTSRAGASLHAR